MDNQRIERLWRDVGRLTIKRYRMLFTTMENQGLLNHDNRLHRMALHFAISDVDAVELDDVLGDESNIVDMLCLEINPLDEDDEDGVLWYRHAVDLLEHSIAE